MVMQQSTKHFSQSLMPEVLAAWVHLIVLLALLSLLAIHILSPFVFHFM